jgi:hypothetical protein
VPFGPDDKFAEEIAQLFGVPFEVIPFKANPQSPGKRREKRYHVHAVPEKEHYEIRFPRVEGETPEEPRYEASRGPGSTAEVDYWTSREPREVIHSHVNYLVPDTQRWEQSAGYFIDTHSAVGAFVKNAGLGFARLRHTVFAQWPDARLYAGLHRATENESHCSFDS